MADVRRCRHELDDIPSVRELRSELRDATRAVGRGPSGDPYNVRNVHLAEDETVALLLPGLASTLVERAASAGDASTSGNGAVDSADPALERFKKRMAAAGSRVITGAPAGSGSNAVKRSSLVKEKPKPSLPIRAATAPAGQTRSTISSIQCQTVQPCEMLLDLPDAPSQQTAFSAHDLINNARSKYRSPGIQLTFPQQTSKPKKSVTIMDGSARVSTGNSAWGAAEPGTVRFGMIRSKSEGRLMARLHASLEQENSFQSPMTFNETPYQSAPSPQFAAPNGGRFSGSKVGSGSMARGGQGQLPSIYLAAPRGLSSSPICASEVLGKRTMGRAAVRRSRSAYNIISA